ncbi:MAG: hypothetical protein SFW65_01710 [Alphaproteobacteria bacterium]|nr:hypothetical protein [Alphaproteobacteria bacterium]
MDRLKAALENLDQSIDGLVDALARRQKELDKVIEARAAKRVKAANETAERALKQAQQRESQAVANEREALTKEREAVTRESKQRELTSLVASRLDQAIVRLEKIVGE